LLTRETALAGRFYASVFGCETEAAAADGGQVTLRADGRPVAGISRVSRELVRDRAPHWMTYFEVKDTDDATHHVAELGGRVVRPPYDSAYGRVATVADTEGAVFTLIRNDS
jgi:uncharacterized protein